jgi:hypothetical protein
MFPVVRSTLQGLDSVEYVGCRGAQAMIFTPVSGVGDDTFSDGQFLTDLLDSIELLLGVSGS